MRGCAITNLIFLPILWAPRGYDPGGKQSARFVSIAVRLSPYRSDTPTGEN
jgi:hypothetical protein